MPIGELFILGFFGKTIPSWLREFATRYGLGGVILFDYSCQTRQYDNNIDSPEQLQLLCEEISRLPSGPMVFVDQEGGLVRRLKEGRGFKPLPSAKEFNHLALQEKRETLAASFAEMRRLGIHYDFAPVIDVEILMLSPRSASFTALTKSSAAANAPSVSDFETRRRMLMAPSSATVPSPWSRKYPSIPPDLRSGAAA